MSENYRKDSFDRFGDDLCQLLLSYQTFKDRFRHECVSTQFRRLVYRSLQVVTIDDRLVNQMKKTSLSGRKVLDSAIMASVLKKLRHIQCLDISDISRTHKQSYASLAELQELCQQIRTIHCNFDIRFEKPFVEAFGPKITGIAWKSSVNGSYLNLCHNLSEVNIPSIALEESCVLKPETGDCKALMQRWYYDIARKDCEHFIYGGCGGNHNNFKSKSQCRQSCRAMPIRPSNLNANVNQLKGTENCELAADSGECDAHYELWFYDSYESDCKTFVYNGCAGNANKFMTRELCENKGPITKTDCSLPPAEGLCRALIPKWHYSPSDKTCKSFNYGGCGGNRNKFEIIEECLDACSIN
ncbi:unnamed protein product [Oppiella nova]|uniref:BPTI/Kunitz inhibitor domain-containing protein n=1 Tax=Oppiella nova TaxID=334625 RepID=A0A7R9QQ44_9ACAR|nr:unnamed protein product [Oppiella nova]CAG2170217.1 unnamed protein product [Oppiella nova]